MNLKTHTAYPETFIDADTSKWVTRLLATDGTVVETITGEADSYDGARDAAAAAVAAVESNYQIEG